MDVVNISHFVFLKEWTWIRIILFCNLELIRSIKRALCLSLGWILIPRSKSFVGKIVKMPSNSSIGFSHQSLEKSYIQSLRVLCKEGNVKFSIVHSSNCKKFSKISISMVVKKIIIAFILSVVPPKGSCFMKISAIISKSWKISKSSVISKVGTHFRSSVLSCKHYINSTYS